MLFNTNKLILFLCFLLIKNNMESPVTSVKLVKRFDRILTLLLIFGGGLLVFLLINRPSLLPTFVILGGILCLGFYLPRHISWQTRVQRALEAKTQELAKWGFASRDREGPWINYIDYPLVYKTAIATGKFFYSDWLVIEDGKIIVNPGHNIFVREAGTVSYELQRPRTYAWDGCTPKRLFYWFALVGTPDWWHTELKIKKLTPTGELVEKTVFWQAALHASLVHDALYQYLDNIPIAKEQVDQLFYAMLLEAQLPDFLANIYLFAVSRFGAADVRSNDPKGNSPYSCDTFVQLANF
jgi:hypothetical protein